MKEVLVGIVDKIAELPVILPSEFGSLARNLKNCVESSEAGAMMSNIDAQELYALCVEIVESLEVTVTGEEYNKIAHTIWNTLCWLRDSLSAMMYLRNFDESEAVVHDLEIISISQLIPSIQLKMIDIFEEDSVHHGHAVRYLSVLNEILIEKGVS